jgi:4-amino-4-deoxy-L-arabinose transferase-like glycosyltransferase
MAVKIFRQRHLVAILFIGGIAGISQYIFLHNNNLYWCTLLTQIQQAARMYRLFHDSSFLALIREVYSAQSYSYYSPFLPICYFVYYCLFGVDTNMGVMTNFGFVICSILGIYHSGKLLFNKRIGVIAGLLWSIMPVMLIEKNSTWYEFPLMCVAPWVMFCVVKSNVFRSLRWSIMFGLTFALLIAIKIEGIILGIIPFGHLMIALIQKGRGDQPRLWQQLKNAAIGTSIGILVVLHGVLLNIKQLLDYYWWHHKMDGPWHLLWAPSYYIDYLISGRFVPRWLWGIFLLVSIVAFLKYFTRHDGRGEAKRICYTQLYVIIPFLVFSSHSLKNYIHIMIIAPFVVLVICGGLSMVRNKKIYNVLTLCFLIYGLIGTVVALRCSFPPPINQKVAGAEVLTLRNIYGDFPLVDPVPWKQGVLDILDCIRGDLNLFADNIDLKNHGVVARVCVFIHHASGQAALLFNYSLAKRMPFDVRCSEVFDALNYDRDDYVIRFEQLGAPSDDWYYIYDKDFYDPRSIFSQTFILFKEIPIGDNRKAIIYKRR